MTPSIRGAAIATALALVLLASSNVSAGNAPLSSATYFSVKLTDGQYLYHSNSNKVLLVDDLTYTCDYKPCDAYTACNFFTPDDLPAFETEPWEYVHQPAFSIEGLQAGLTESSVSSWGSGGGMYRRISGLAARHAFTEVGLRDSTDGASGDWFDRFSFTTYGQVGWTETREHRQFESWMMVEEVVFRGEFWDWVRYPIRDENNRIIGWDEVWELIDEDDGGVGVGTGGAGGYGVGLGEGTGVSVASTPASGSRHYQTPHIVQNGRVYFLLTNPYTMTVNGTVYVKGRVVDASSAPTVDTGITVATAP